jgi:hypothetical protein
MNLTLWIVQALLAAVFAMTGGAKLLRPRLALADRMPYVVDFSDRQIKAIGSLEVVSAAGLVVPPLLGIGLLLTPLAALGLVGTMIGAALTHIRRREPQSLPVNVVLMVLAAVVAWGRFGPYHF